MTYGEFLRDSQHTKPTDHTNGTMHIKRSLALLLPILPLTLLAFACAQDPAPSEAEEMVFAPLTEQEAAEIVYDTIVYPQEDGTLTAKAVPITRGARRVQEMARLHRKEMPSGDLAQTSSAIQRDGGCSSTSFWAYDQPNLQGNRLCLEHPETERGTAALSTFGYLPCSRCLGGYQGTWDEKIKSFYAGYKAGNLFGYRLPYSYLGGAGTTGTSGTGSPLTTQVFFNSYELRNTYDVSPLYVTLQCPYNLNNAGTGGVSSPPSSCPG